MFLFALLTSLSLLSSLSDDVAPDINQGDVISQIDDYEEPLEDEIIEDNSILYALEDESIIVAELQKSNEYWELFLDSYTVTEHPTYLFLPLSVRISSARELVAFSSGWNCFYIDTSLIRGDLIIHFSIESPGNAQVRGGYYSSISEHTTTPSLTLNTSVGGDFDVQIYPNNGYFVFSYPSSSLYITRFTYTYDSSYSYQESYTLSELGNAVMTINDKVDKLDDVTRLLECVTFVNCMLLLVPMIRSISKKERKL